MKIERTAQKVIVVSQFNFEVVSKKTFNMPLISSDTKKEKNK
jgi:hypothetical protein